jgi:hypothetical protein
MTLGITLTGADERTELGRLLMLADAGAEIGLLYTFDPEGRHRYPSASWLRDVVYLLGERCAVHLCGGRARDELFKGHLSRWLFKAGRIQVNGVLSSRMAEDVCEMFPRQTIITQHTGSNVGLLAVEEPNHAVLVDGSGGRGVLPPSWKRPDTSKRVGFAGGLGPDNLTKKLPAIASVGGESWWVDMENKLRDADDWFDVEKATAAMTAWKAFVDSREAS